MIDVFKKGDKVVIMGGFYGEVVSIEFVMFVFKILDGVKVKVFKLVVIGFQGEVQ